MALPTAASVLGLGAANLVVANPSDGAIFPEKKNVEQVTSGGVLSAAKHLGGQVAGRFGEFAKATGGFALANVVGAVVRSLLPNAPNVAHFVGGVATAAGAIYFRQPSIATGAGIQSVRSILLSLFGNDRSRGEGMLGGNFNVDDLDGMLMGLRDDELDDLIALAGANDPDVLKGLLGNSQDPDVLMGADDPLERALALIG